MKLIFIVVYMIKKNSDLLNDVSITKARLIVSKNSKDPNENYSGGMLIQKMDVLLKLIDNKVELFNFTFKELQDQEVNLGSKLLNFLYPWGPEGMTVRAWVSDIKREQRNLIAFHEEKLSQLFAQLADVVMKYEQLLNI